MSIKVFDELQIEDAGILDMNELTYFTPNVYSQQNVNTNTVIIRGVSSHNATLHPPVGLLVDDINYPLSVMQNTDLLDIERVEILRGPQGSLYGVNSEAGVIKIITNQPGNELKGKIFGECGIYDTPDDNPMFFRAGGSVSGPVVKDKLYLGLSFQTKNSDGYVENELDGDDKVGKRDQKTGRGVIRWTPTEEWDISLLLNGYENDNGFGIIRYINGPHKTDRYKIRHDGLNDWEDENNAQNFKVKYNGDRFNVVAITTRTDFESKLLFDSDYTPMSIFNADIRYDDTLLSQEIRVSSVEGDGAFEWLFGVYGFKEDNKTRFGGMGAPDRFTEYDRDGYAAFGQATYTFFNRLHFTAGLRYDVQEADGEQACALQPAPYGADLEHDEFLPKASVAYDVNDSFMAYTSVAKGLLAGGYNYAQATGSDDLAFDPEYTWNYEMGVKTSWFDNKLLVNAAVFYIDIEDKQALEYISGAEVWKVTNAASAHSQGFELEFQSRPVQRLTLMGGFGYTESKVDSWVSDEPNGGQFDYEDKYLTYSPKYTYNLGANYSLPSGFFGRADLLGTGPLYTDCKNTTKIDGYETVNLRLGYQGESYDVVIWAKNIFDKEYLNMKLPFIGGEHSVDGQPRTIGITATYRF